MRPLWIAGLLSLALHGLLLGWDGRSSATPAGESQRGLTVRLIAPTSSAPAAPADALPSPPTERAAESNGGNSPPVTAPAQLAPNTPAPPPVSPPPLTAGAPNIIAGENSFPAHPAPEPAVESTGISPSSNPVGDGGEQLEALQRVVRSEVERHKRYPTSALLRQKEGTTRVGFRVQPGGEVEGVAILRSSGDGALDRAAVTAIAAISPVAGASRFISHAHTLEIEVIFRLD